MCQCQGSMFDPEGEYVRQWLPELARMPTEWIHHPWDAPPTILNAAGVELGQNYPRPIVDIELARDRLTSAILKMWELDAAARSSISNGADEEVGDNSNSNENLAIPVVILKEEAPSTTRSSNDQKVPTFQNFKKRSKLMDEEPPADKRKIRDDVAGQSRTEEDLHSTAESSASKKPTTSRCSFSVPQFCSSSDGSHLQENESSDIKQKPWQLQSDVEQSSSKEGI